MAPKVTQALSELGISHSRLVMPTRENCAQLESLLDATSALVETKKVVDKVEYDIKILKARLGIRGSEGAEEGGDGMEVDEGGDGDDGRAQSVVSTRSGRSRKHVGHFLIAYCIYSINSPLHRPDVQCPSPQSIHRPRYPQEQGRSDRNGVNFYGTSATCVCTPCVPMAM